jgi:hypothetical protein
MTRGEFGKDVKVVNEKTREERDDKKGTPPSIIIKN